MSLHPIITQEAPAAIGSYSQAIQAGNTVYLSGQIPLDPKTMQLAQGIEAQIACVFNNLSAVAHAAGASLAHIAKLTVYLTDLAHAPALNTYMASHFSLPYPARAVVGVAALPRQALIEIDAIAVVPSTPQGA
ncbi:Rid family detoxifying hydrolase [Polaromonas sp. SM01]|uniref:Rid family detoxifying hydrolase n=1 Tax=Polaromonas sp. SM01 TaxID=3085630 RepID=UPI0029818EF2|nr:Rid family detoxifying hydrolase [Polaromonas sp. SM01]MDW5444659.1 Rid family detoxifying hydrolase [Polaromonas sp. SM01]